VKTYFACVLLTTGAACGGSKTKVIEPAVVARDAGTDAQDAAVERPFAATALEAQTMIQAQVAERMKTLWTCVEAYRTRTSDPHRAVTVNVGIDQEGHLFGVTAADPKHAELDPALKACLLEALRVSVFPRSHTGVITIRQTFQDTPMVR
jgi:hypothetical protein